MSFNDAVEYHGNNEVFDAKEQPQNTSNVGDMRNENDSITIDHDEGPINYDESDDKDEGGGFEDLSVSYKPLSTFFMNSPNISMSSSLPITIKKNHTSNQENILYYDELLQRERANRLDSELEQNELDVIHPSNPSSISSPFLGRDKIDSYLKPDVDDKLEDSNSKH